MRAWLPERTNQSESVVARADQSEFECGCPSGLIRVTGCLCPVSVPFPLSLIWLLGCFAGIIQENLDNGVGGVHKASGEERSSKGRAEKIGQRCGFW